MWIFFHFEPLSKLMKEPSQADSAQSSQETVCPRGPQPALAQSGREDGGAEQVHQGGDHHDEEVSRQEEVETHKGHNQVGE